MVGGKKDAQNGEENLYLTWSCGKDGGFDTPNLKHPYDCSPYGDRYGDPPVDGPVALVAMPSCMEVSDPLHSVYPEGDGGPDDKVAPRPPTPT